MEFLFDHELDWLRLVVMLSCFVSSVGLVYRRFNPPNDEWNPKTKDYWFALLTFSVAGVAATVDSLVSNVNYTGTLPLIFIASLVCINGLRRRGRWRGDQE